MVRLIGKIDEFKGYWRNSTEVTPERLAALKQVATIESVGSSTRIEGAKLSDQDVEQLLSGLSTQSFKTRDEQEVVGYAEVMKIVFDNSAAIPLSENHIKQLHRDLLKHSVKDERHRGDYKTVPNHVEATEPDGTKYIVFETTTPFDTPFQMTELVDWINENIQKQDIHSLVTTAAFVAEFLAIHPFKDGNGRLSRVLTTLILLKAGYSYVPFSSLESIIEQNKQSYYLALRKTQQTLKEEAPNWDPWLNFFLQSMHKQMEKLKEKIEREIKLQPNLPTLSIRILEIVRDRGSVQMSDLEDLLGESRSTIKNRVQDLVAADYLSKNGKARATWYTRGPKK
jgi:Fic family protein